jgi:hypothetical protein
MDGRRGASHVLSVALGAAVLCGPLITTTPASGRPTSLLVGVADQGPATFGNRLYRRLGLRISRLMVPLNTAFDPDRREWVSRWLAAAKADGVEPLVAFSRFFGTPTALPSVAAYRRAFIAFRRAFPEVTEFIPWNEENHQAQPTFRRPGRAAAYYEVMRNNCPGCQILAADVLDTHGAEKWLTKFLHALHGPPPRLWGLHNYIDANRHRPPAHSGTAAMLAKVHGTIWLTETGGLVKTAVHPYNERRAARAIRYLFTITSALRSRIARVYVYNWRGVVNAAMARAQPLSWDSGLTEPNGKPRPGYFALRYELRRLHLGCWSPGAAFSTAPWLADCL